MGAKSTGSPFLAFTFMLAVLLATLVAGASSTASPSGRPEMGDQLAPATFKPLPLGRAGSAEWPKTPLLPGETPEQVEVVAQRLSPESGWAGPTALCGSISEDMALPLIGSPYSVTCDTTLETGVTLAIEPGVVLGFESGVGLTVLGTLLASGTQALPIVFTSARSLPSPGDWSGLRFEAGSSESQVVWCVVEYATTGVGVYAEPGITISPTLASCTVRHHSSHGILVEGASRGCEGGHSRPVIIDCTIEDNLGCGVYGYGHGDENHGCVPAEHGSVGGNLYHSTIRGNKQSGVCLHSEPGYQSGGDVSMEINGNRISANSGDGIRMYGNDKIHPRILNNAIYANAGSGIHWDAEHGDSDLFVVNNTVVANGGDGLRCYRFAERMQVTNNVVAGQGGYGLFCATGLHPQLLHNDVWSNSAGDYAGCLAGTADISADPLLEDVAAGDFHLLPGSPCIDAGTGGAPETDIEGISRPQGDGFDIGAHEFWSPWIEVTQGMLEIAPGSRYEFGREEVGSSRAVNFAIGNLGNKALMVEYIDIVPAEHFAWSMHDTLPLTVAPGMSTTFDVHFAPVATGEQVASVSIAHDSPVENPLTFFVGGLGTRALGELSLNGPSSGLMDTSYTFTATAGPADATQPITYTWQATGQPTRIHLGDLSDSVSWTWSAPGVQSITATAENVQNVITRTHLVTLYVPARADFDAAPRSGVAPLAVVFANTSSGDYAVAWWDFGDGMTSTLSSPTHTYVASGAYTVSLEVDGAGGSDMVGKRSFILVEGRRVYLPAILNTVGNAGMEKNPQSDRR